MTEALCENKTTTPLNALIFLLGSDAENIYANGATERLIRNAQKELAVTFPRDYIQFLKELDGGNFRYMRIYSLGKHNNEIYNLNEQLDIARDRFSLVASGELFPFGDNYDSNLYCFSVHDNGKYSIVQLHDNKETPTRLASSFAEFLEYAEFAPIQARLQLDR